MSRRDEDLAVLRLLAVAWPWGFFWHGALVGFAFATPLAVLIHVGAP